MENEATSASNPISKVFSEITAVHASEIQRCVMAGKQSPHIDHMIKPVMVRSNHSVLVLSLDMVSL